MYYNRYDKIKQSIYARKHTTPKYLLHLFYTSIKNKTLKPLY